MQQINTRARNTIDKSGITTLKTPQWEYQFVSHLLFKDVRDMKRTVKDFAALYLRIVESGQEAIELYSKAKIGKRKCSHYQRHIVDVVMFISEFDDAGLKLVKEAA